MINTQEEIFEAKKYFETKLSNIADEEAWYYAFALELIDLVLTPKKPIIKYALGAQRQTCPNCGDLLIKVHSTSHCATCGQAIDRSDEE